MMRLYSATTEELTICDKLPSRVRKLPDVSDDLQRKVEKLLDERCPKGRQLLRLSSWFACDEAHFAAQFLNMQLQYGRNKHLRKGQPRLYVVEMDKPGDTRSAWSMVLPITSLETKKSLPR
jgi:hypothetical protein